MCACGGKSRELMHVRFWSTGGLRHQSVPCVYAMLVNHSSAISGRKEFDREEK
jgi:hypothetical protein